MNGPFRKDESENLTPVINQLLAEMTTYGPGTPEHAAALDQLERMVDIKRKYKRQWSITPDTLVLAGANVLIALIVIGFEQKHVVTTKAHTFFLKKNP